LFLLLEHSDYKQNVAEEETRNRHESRVRSRRKEVASACIPWKKRPRDKERDSRCL